KERVFGGEKGHHLAVQAQQLHRLGDQLVALLAVPLDKTHAADFDVAVAFLALVGLAADAPGRGPALACAIEIVLPPLHQVDLVTGLNLAAADQAPGGVETAWAGTEDTVVFGHGTLLVVWDQALGLACQSMAK